MEGKMARLKGWEMELLLEGKEEDRTRKEGLGDEGMERVDRGMEGWNEQEKGVEEMEM